MKTTLAAAFLALAGCATAPPADPPEVQRERWQASTEAGVAAARAGRRAEAEQLFRQALAAIATMDGQERCVVLTLNQLAALYLQENRPDAALAVLTRASALAESKLGPEDPDTAVTKQNLAGARGLARKEAAP